MSRKIILDRKSGSAGMPRPISYAVFCLKKKKKLMQIFYTHLLICLLFSLSSFTLIDLHSFPTRRSSDLVLAAQPVTTNLLKFMRASIKMIGVSNLQSFIASMTQKLTLSDISDESENYL